MKSIVPISVLSRLPSIGITIRQNSIEVADIIAHKEKHVKVYSEDDGQGSAPEKEHAEGTQISSRLSESYQRPLARYTRLPGIRGWCRSDLLHHYQVARFTQIWDIDLPYLSHPSA